VKNPASEIANQFITDNILSIFEEVTCRGVSNFLKAEQDPCLLMKKALFSCTHRILHALNLFIAQW
jgi:hypothetical protein